MTRINDPDAARAVDETLGVVPQRLSAGEAAYEIAVAAAFDHSPDPRAVETRDRVRAQQEAVASLAPWRAAVDWSRYGDVLELEEAFAQLASSRRGMTIPAARDYVTAQLREAWAKSTGGTPERVGAVEKAIAEGIRHFRSIAPITGRPVPSKPPRPGATEADFDRAVAEAFGREVRG